MSPGSAVRLVRQVALVGRYFHPDPVPAGTVQDIFDARYLKVAPPSAQRRDADQMITAFLSSVRDQWVKGIRKQHS